VGGCPANTPLAPLPCASWLNSAPLPFNKPPAPSLPSASPTPPPLQANIVKLPNVSASVPQLTEAVAELTKKGYPLPPFTLHPTSEQDKDNYARSARPPRERSHHGRGMRLPSLKPTRHRLRKLKQPPASLTPLSPRCAESLSPLRPHQPLSR
jgi:hypothetical protein